MLVEYISKPVTVLACEIKKEGKIKKKEGGYVYTHKGRGAVMTCLEFTTNAEQEVRTGDFIIKLSNTDCYLCPANVFERKYGIKGMVIR